MILSTSDDNNEILPRFPTPQPCHLGLQEQKCPLDFVAPKGRVPPQGCPQERASVLEGSKPPAWPRGHGARLGSASPAAGLLQALSSN